MMKLKGAYPYFIAAILASAISMVGVGCNSQSILQKVAVTVSPDLSTISVGLVFANNIQATISGDIPVGTYGDIFVDPYTPTTPFELGFNLNTSIVNDQNYIKLTPTQYFPNGYPIGLSYPVVQVQRPTPIGSNFDIYAYIDVLHGDWLGAAAILNFIDQNDFPEGMTINQVFKRDAAGNPEVFAAVFGPELNPDGSIKVPGGIAVFANAKEIITGHDITIGQQNIFGPDGDVIVTGPNAKKYEGNFKFLDQLQNKLRNGLNGLK